MSRAHLSAAGRSIAAPHHELVLEADERERRKLEGLRARSEARRNRFLQAHTRMYGVDREAITAQIEERKRREEAEREAERVWAEQQAQAQLHLQQRDAAQHEAEREQRQRLLASWEQQQAEAEARRRREQEERRRAARLGPEDRSLGPSSLQVFDGEDPHAAERRRMQALQVQRWAAQQRAEKDELARQRREEDERYAQYVLDMEAAREELERRVRGDERAEQRRAAAENEALRRSKEARARRDRARERRLDDAHAATLAHDPVLNEDESRRASALGAHRIRVDHYKGMTGAELEGILRERAGQVEALRRARQAEREEDHEWGRRFDQAVQYADLLAREQAVERVRVAERQRAMLEQQALEQRRLKEQRKHDNTNEVTSGFFNRFGTSDR